MSRNAVVLILVVIVVPAVSVNIRVWGQDEEIASEPSLSALLLESAPQDSGEADEIVFGDVSVGMTEEVMVVSPEDVRILGEPISASPLGFGDWLGYNSTAGDWTWVAARRDLGIFSMQTFPTISLGEKTSFETGWGVHFLSGPTETEMPARLFDFEMALRTRRMASSQLMLDLKFGVGAFSDFEGSARKGVRFPGHAVGYYELDPWFIGVLGVEVLDRDDISLLPVAGGIWRMSDDLICELVFPRPKIQYRISNTKSFYVGAELGGGTWAIEREQAINDVATYRDIRVTCGVMTWGGHDDTVLEIGCALARNLEYRSGLEYEPDNALILRWRSHF